MLACFEGDLPDWMVRHSSFPALRSFLGRTPQDYSLFNACIEVNLSADASTAFDTGISFVLTRARNQVVQDNLLDLWRGFGSPDTPAWKTALRAAQGLQQLPVNSDFFRLIHSVWHCFDGTADGYTEPSLTYLSMVARPIDLAQKFRVPEGIGQALSILYEPALLASCMEGIQRIERAQIAGLALAHVGVSMRANDSFPKLYLAGEIPALGALVERLDAGSEHGEALRLMDRLAQGNSRIQTGAYLIGETGLEKLDLELYPTSEAPHEDEGFFEQVLRSLKADGTVQWDRQKTESLTPWFDQNRRVVEHADRANAVLTFSHLKLVWRRGLAPALKAYFIFHQGAALR